jgi:hypothetical protein
MLLAITLIAGFLAYHANWIRQRRVLAAGGVPTGVNILFGDDLKDPFSPATAPPPPKRAAGLLWLFGERGHHNIYVSFTDSPWPTQTRELAEDEQRFVERVRRLFPEATVGAAAFQTEDGAQASP